MKILRNPWVVGVLSLLAVVVVFYQTSHSRWQSGLSAEAPPQSQGTVQAEPSPAPPSHATSPKGSIQPDADIDQHYAESHLAGWAESPGRDPFLLVTLKAGTGAVTPVSRWKLQAIWSQTGGRVAVINQHIHSEGDVIDGYKIERIDTDRVWLDGPDGKEILAFGAGPGESGRPSPVSGSKRFFQ
jgi:hypothetical protein